MHRDVKPSNCIINWNLKKLYLIDWGLSEFYVKHHIYPYKVSTKNYKAP